MDKTIRRIRDAADLDTALDGYASGMAVDSGNVDLHRAYLRKVVDLDAPKLGENAARHVLSVDPGDGLARAVLADSEARQGAMVDALTDISLAARRAPNEPFVQRTAAHLLAWIDNHLQPPKLPSSVQTSLQNARASLENAPAYVAAYKDATNYIRDEQQRATRTAEESTSAAATDRTYSTPTVADRLPDRPEVSSYAGGNSGYSSARPSEATNVYNNHYYYDAPYASPYAYAYPYSYDYPYGLGISFGYFGGYGYGNCYGYNFNRGYRNCYFGHSGGFGYGSYGIGRSWNGGVSTTIGIGSGNFYSGSGYGAVYGRSGFSGNYSNFSNYGNRGYSYGSSRNSSSIGRSWNGRASGSGNSRSTGGFGNGMGSGGNRGGGGGGGRR